ncbi:MAG: type II toxin-antitoxin system VapB family antitoxin [Desulfobacteria bacterium]|jgi:Arc/MetJ family transcription regulator
MRTNIDIDDALVSEAFKYSRAKTKKELIHQALKEFVENRRRLNLLELEGRIEFVEGYNHKSMREGK